MSLFKNFSRELLYEPHQLTHHQIDMLLAEDTGDSQFMEKAAGLKITWEFLSIFDSFQANKINFIPLKGPVLSFRVFSDPTIRNFVDLDILVEESSMPAADLLLKEMGYHAIPFSWPSNNRLRKILGNHDNQLTYYHHEKEIAVELHWKLLKAPPVTMTKLQELIKSNTTMITYDERSIEVFNPEFELLYLIIHGGLHAWRRLKWIVDINALLLTLEIDWEKFAHLTKKLKAGRLAALCNSILKEFYPDGPLLQIQDKCPNSFLKFSLSRIKKENDIELSFISGFLRSVIFHYRVFPGCRYKLNNIKNLLFVKEYFGQNRILSSIPLFYFYGFSRFVFRRLKKKLRKK